MILSENFEKIIEQTFRSLPRKTLPALDREQIWLRIQTHIRQGKSVAEKYEKSFGLTNFLPRRAWFRALATILIVLFAVSLVSGAASATPGETLYPVKKAAEKVEKVLAANDEAKVKVNVKHAKRRLEEVQILVQQNRQTGEVVAETLNALTNTTLDAVAASESRPELQNQIVELANHEEEILGTVQSQAQGKIKEAIEKAILATKESISKLQAGEGVKGTATAAVSEDQSLDTQATSTLPQTHPKSQPKVNPQEGIVRSEIQIHGVIKLGENGNQTPQPEIVTQP